VAEFDPLRQGVTGRQAYFLDVPGTASAAALSIVSFIATEKMGAPTEVRIELTHPQQLARADYLNLDAAFSIVPDDGPPRKFSGFIARFSTIQSTRDYVKYEVVLKSHMARLEAVTRRKIFQHASTPDIIEAILRSHGLREHQFSFRLRGQYRKHLFRMQHQMSDSAYIHMLAEKAGIYFFIVETEYGDQVVFGDDIDHYIYDPRMIVPYCEAAGLEAGGIEAVTAIKTHTVTVPQSFTVADYNPEQAWERFRDTANIAPQDRTTYGQPYIYGTHHLDQAGAKWEAQLRHEAAIAWQVVYEGETTVLALQPARVLETDTALPDAPKGQVIIEATHSGARDKPYMNRYTAIPADRRFRLKLEPEKWAKVTGTLSARVTSPDKYKYAYITAAGYYTVRFDVDFDTWPNGGESVPLRLAKPFAGKLQTGMHFPALDDAEAVITCRDGDPDKPEIVAFHHHSQARDLVTNGRRWLSRNTIRTQANNKLRMEDWAGQEGVKLSTEHSGKSQLNLGYLVDKKLEKRGEGYEHRTSGYGVNRAGKGLHLTAYDRPGATGRQLDMQETIAQLESALATAKALAASASSAKAGPADSAAQQQMKDDFDGLKKPGLLMSTPASAGIVAGGGVQLSAQDSISTVAGKNADFSVVKRFTVAAGEYVSMFTQKLGIKIFAAKGPIDVQAQGGALSLIADKDVMAASVNGKVNLAAAKEIILECGGAFIQIKDGSITLGGPGDLFLKTITVQKKGKESIRIPLPALPIALDQLLFSNRVDLSDAGFATANTDHAWANLTYLVADKAGNNLASGKLDDAATGSRFFSREPKDVDVWIGTPGWEPTEETLSDVMIVRKKTHEFQSNVGYRRNLCCQTWRYPRRDCADLRHDNHESCKAQ
jgi:type VI secretion system secreted protein VgrG